MINNRIQDEWSPLSFIQWMGGENGRAPQSSPNYLLLSDQRRLRAYAILASFMQNTRRTYLDGASLAPVRRDPVSGHFTVGAPEADSYREYGDAMLLVEVLRDLVLGESQTPVVGDQEERARVLAETPENAEPPADPADAARAWIQDWWRAERLDIKFVEAEEKACGLGDVVYTLGVSERSKRPKLRVLDPGFYFPDSEADVPGWDDEDFPPIVHLLWEYETAENVEMVRRATYAMVKLDAGVTAPWAAEGDGLREWTCTYREVEWKKSELYGSATVYSQEMGRDETVIVDTQDLMVDFIPVVHVPNTAGEWGRSILLLAAQLLDDVQGSDSDIAKAAQTANPLLVSSSDQPVRLTGMPGEAMSLDGADAKYISASLTGQLEHLEALMKRLAQNTRLGEVLLGRVSPADVPSGYALALGFHPARQVMRNARLVRGEKYPLILKFALRLAQAHGWAKDIGPTPQIEVEFGSSLPSDIETAVDTVKSLREAGALSSEGAVRILVEAGLPIGDAEEEVARLEREDTEAMVRLVEALGSQGITEVLRRLGIDQTVTTTVTAPEGDQ